MLRLAKAMELFQAEHGANAEVTSGYDALRDLLQKARARLAGSMEDWPGELSS